MGLFDGKTPSERNKIIAAAVLGVVSLVALYMAFGRSFFGGSATTATTKASPTPTPKKAATTAANSDQFALPTSDQDALNITVPVVYRPGNTYGAPDPGRNIFAFYEPPPPTPYQTPSPTPPKPEVIPTPSPVPTPVFLATGVSPGSIYAGTKGLVKLEISGDRFTPNARIYFNQTELPTNFVSAQQLTATLTENMFAQEGQRQILIQTPDGTAYSNPLSMTVMAPPRPTTLQYIGMIGRKRYNNDTAYFIETGKTTPLGARLNDVVGSRFRLIDISAASVVLEDVNLGFRHRIAITPAGTGTGNQPGGGFVPYNPAQGQLPPNSPRVVPQPPRPDQRRPPNSKDDVDDNDDPPR
ncbi:MAG: IPT/TIG domain-containing protein [Pyrinomonadaceae bacterium]